MAVAVCIIVPTAMHAAFWISADFGTQKIKSGRYPENPEKIGKGATGNHFKTWRHDRLLSADGKSGTDYLSNHIEQLNEYGIGYLIVTKSIWQERNDTGTL